jgi:dihydrofolate reductase
MQISVIVAMSENRVIGREGRLPWHLPADLKRFRTLTMGHPILMGRKTFESIGRVLPGRVNFVITRQKDYRIEGAKTVGSLQAALDQCRLFASECFIIGGGEIYREALARVDQLYLTLIHQEIEGDAYFPAFSANDFQEVERERFEFPIPYSFITLKRRSF